jgi:hypothetical protein
VAKSIRSFIVGTSDSAHQLPENKKPVQLAAERVSGESRFSWICIAPASCEVTPESNRRWL